MPDVLDQLAQIPELALEVLLTWNHPNHSGDAPRRQRVADTRPPTDLGVLDLLRVTADDLDGKPRPSIPVNADLQQGSERLLGRLSRCVRVVCEECPDHPDPNREWVTFAGECAWLARTYPLWSGDRFTADWVTSEVANVHKHLSVAARVEREPRYACRKCGGTMHLCGEAVLQCAECGREEGANLEYRYRRMTPKPASWHVAEFNVTHQQMAKWRKARQLKAQRHEGGEHWFYPWDVLLLAHPDIAEAVEQREGLDREMTGAERWLSDYLARHPEGVEVGQVRADAERELGVTDRTLRRAAAAIGIEKSTGYQRLTRWFPLRTCDTPT